MKNTELAIFEQRLEGQPLASALALRETDKKLAGEVAPLMKEIGELQAKMKDLQKQVESKYVQFDELRVSFFQALEASLGIDLDSSSLDFRDDGSVFVVRTQEDIDRVTFLRSMRENPLAVLRQALEGGEVEVLEGCGNEDCPNCATKH